MATPYNCPDADLKPLIFRLLEGKTVIFAEAAASIGLSMGRTLAGERAATGCSHSKRDAAVTEITAAVPDSPMIVIMTDLSGAQRWPSR